MYKRQDSYSTAHGHCTAHWLFTNLLRTLQITTLPWGGLFMCNVLMVLEVVLVVLEVVLQLLLLQLRVLVRKV